MDGERRLGWAVVDVRTMKQAASIHAPDGETPGTWLALSSPSFKGEKGQTAPEIRVFAALRETQPLPDGGHSPRASVNARAARVTNADAGVERSAEAARADASFLAGVSAGGIGAFAKNDRAAADENAPPATTKEVLHLFSLCCDVRSFKSTRRMPFPTASVVVKLTLPAALLDAVELGGRTHAAVQHPVRTNPPAQVSRASEVTLQNGSGVVDFGAGVMALATALATGPRLLAEVWHKDKYEDDTLLGTAHVSLAPLLQEPVLDGYAPVIASGASGEAGAPKSSNAANPETIKVGELRMVLSLAEKGPLPLWATKMSGYDRFPLSQSAEAPTRPLGAGGYVGAPVTNSLRNSLERINEADAAREHVRKQNMTVMQALKSSFAGASAGIGPGGGGGEGGYTEHEAHAHAHAAAAHAPPGATANMAHGVGESVQSMDGAGLRKGKEYAVAWELEVWKQSQEAKWTANMRAKEAERMAALEGEWRRREAQREAEHRRAKEDCSNLEKKLSAALSTVEERERRLVAAEESLSVRREAERRELAQRMSEAQHAVRRLQQECEHQLDMEKGRSKDVERQKAALEERVEEANARAAAVERAFHGYKRAHLESSEATLHAEIARLQTQRADAEAAAAEAIKSRDRFKTQIQKMAKQVVALERERTYLRAAVAHVGGDVGGDRGGGGGGGVRAKVFKAPKPAPSGADFMSDLFGVGGSFDAKTTGGPQMMSVAAGVAAAGAGADDDFLADFRSSIAKLEREARAAEGGGGGGGGIQGLSPVDEGEKTRRTTATRRERDDDDDDDDVRASFDDGERPAWRPAGSPLRNRHAADERPPPRSPMKSPPGKPPLSPIKRAAAPTRPPRSPPPARASESALSQLRSKRVEARAAAGLDRDPPRLVERSWSADDNEGLKELFASATEYEREEAARDAAAATARPKDAESEDDDSATDRSTAGDRSVPESIASSDSETSAAPAPAPLPPKPPRGPVTAATLAEKRALEKEVRRLVAERAELMGTGAYSSSDRVIALIDEKITEITRRVARG